MADLGLLDDILVTQDNIIVSGHQRIRACRELGIEMVPIHRKMYSEFNEKGICREDQILEELIDINLQQRGSGNDNPIKLARCIREKERINGIRQGSAGKPHSNNFNGKLKKSWQMKLGSLSNNCITINNSLN